MTVAVRVAAVAAVLLLCIVYMEASMGTERAMALLRSITAHGAGALPGAGAEHGAPKRRRAKQIPVRARYNAWERTRPSNSEVSNLRSSKKCTRMPGWCDVCVYENVCFDGSMWYFLEPKAPKKPQEDQMFAGVADMLEGYLLPMNPVPDVGDEYFPFNSGPAMKGVHVNPQYLLLKGVTVTWVVNSSFWFVPFTYGMHNIWYYGTRILPLYKARKMNESDQLPFVLPPLESEDIIYVPHEAGWHDVDWHKNVLHVATGGRARVEYKDTKWGKQWTEKNIVCFRKAVATGANAFIMPDISTGFSFRKDMYDHMGVALPSEPPKKVLFWLRNVGGPRNIANEKELLRIAESYNLSYTLRHDAFVPSPDGSPTRMLNFTEQFELFSTHGIMVTPHGAGLVNMMFLPPFSGVVEMFPYHLDHIAYSTMASQVGLGNYPVHAINGSILWSSDKEHMEKGCDDLPSLEINYVSADCRSGVVSFSFDVDLESFERALVNAVQHAGHRLRYRNIRPRRTDTTKTGWVRRRR